MAILSNTLFSGLFIILIFGLMYNQPGLFVNISRARNQISPMILRTVLPIVLLELLIFMIYNIPFAFWKDHEIKQIVAVIGL